MGTNAHEVVNTLFCVHCFYQAAIAEDEDDDENMGFVELDNGLVIYKQLVERLYPHQV